MKKTGWMLGSLLIVVAAFANDAKACDMASHKAATAAAHDGKSCDMAAHKTAGAHTEKSCNMAAHAAEKSVDMTGKLLCKHCNLHQGTSCEKVFQPSGDEKTLYAVCPHSKVDVEKVGEEGAATLRIKGKLVKCSESGQQAILIDEATRIAEAGK